MSQLGRISGQLLKDNLTRNGHDLTFDRIDDPNPLVAKEGLLHLDVTNRRVGINTETPEYDLDVNGVTRTTDLEVTNRIDISVDDIITPTTGITISGNTITSNTGTLNLTNTAGDQVTYQAKLVVDNIELEDNVISTNAGANLELRPNGTGTVEVYADTNIYGDVYVTGNIRADGNITVGDSNTDNITINADVASDIIPDADVAYKLGNGGTVYTEGTEFTLGDVTLTVSSTGSVVVLSIPAAGPPWITQLVGHSTGKSYQITLYGEPGVYSVNTLGAWSGVNPQTVSTTNDGLVDGVYSVNSIRFDQKRWLDLRVTNIYTDAIVSGDITVDGIQLSTDQGKIYYVATNGSDTNAGKHQNDPFATVKKALSVATGEDQIYIYPGTYVEEFPLVVPVGVDLRGTGIRSVKIVPTTATRYNDAFLINGESTVEDITIADFFSGGNYFTVTAASLNSTTVNVGTAPYAHTYVSGGTINIGGTDYTITNAVYTHTTGVLVITHTGGTATPSTTVFLSNLTFSCNGGERVFPDNGYAFRFATDFAVTSRSPYIRNITVLTKGSVTSLSDPLGYNAGDAGKGAYIDGAYATALSKEASMLFHSVTFICPGVDVVVATNGARVEWLNSFTYYANRSMYLYSSADGFAGDGKTRIKITNTTGTWAVGNTLYYYDTNGTTILAQGVIESIDGDFYNIDGRVLGFEAIADRTAKTITVHGGAALSTSVKKYGTASLALDGVGDELSVPPQADFNFGTGNFTLECWIYPTAVPTAGQYAFVMGQSKAGVGNSSCGLYLGSAAGTIYLYSFGTFGTINGAAVAQNAWSHIALTREGNDFKLWINGTQAGSTVTYAGAMTSATTTNFTIGGNAGYNLYVTGYIDDVRVSKGVARYTGTFTAPTTQLTGDLSTVLLITCNGTNGSTAIADNGITLQDLRTDAGGAASIIDFADYSDFGVELRSIGSASVYGNYGIYGDGPGVIAYLIGQNLAYIGNGKETTNDPNTVIQANEVVELNDAKIFYNSVDHKGDFRIGDLFYVNQATGEVSFTNSNINIGTSLTFDNGLGDVTYLDATKIETGDFRISGNTVETLTQDFNIDAATNQINLQSNVTVTGNLDVTGDVTVGGNVTIGNESTDTVQFVAGVDSDILPALPSTYDLGTPTERWSTLYSTTLVNADIQISTNVITTTNSNLDLTLQANGSGRIYVPSNNVEITNNLTVNGTTDVQDLNVTGTLTHVGDVTQTGNLTQTGDITLTGTFTTTGYGQFADIKIDNNNISTTIGTNDLVLDAAGTGRVYVPDSDVEITQDLTVTGYIDVGSLTVDTTISSLTLTAGDVKIESNFITTLTGNNNLELRANGTGLIYVPSNDVQIDNNLTVLGTTNLATTNIGVVGTPATVTHVGGVTQTGDLFQTGNTEITGTLTVGSTAQFEDINIDNNVITTTLGNNNLVLEAAGTGKVIVPLDNAEVTGTLTVTGTTSTTTINNTGTVTSGTFTTGNISINGNTIQTTVTNSNLQLQAAGTGYIVLEQFDVQENELRINSGTDMTIAPNGTGIVNINSTQSIKLPVGDNAARPATPVNGMIRFNTQLSRYEGYNGTAWTRLDGVEDSDGNTKITAELTPGANDNTIRFYADGTQVADLTSTRLNTINLDVGVINVNNNVISTTTTNTNLILSPNGTGSVRIGNFSISSNTFINTVNNSITAISQTGDGYVKINSTGGFVIPVGRTDQRPAIFELGMMRYNTSDERVEIWNGTAWVGVAQGASSGVTADEATDISIVSAFIFG
jgi:hypothetical protein